MKPKRKPISQRELKRHQKLIDTLGRARLIELTELTPQAISHWYYNGIPRSWLGSISTLK